MSKRKLNERMTLFNAGDWAQLLLERTALQRQELKQQFGSVVNMFRTTFLGEQRGLVGVVGRVVSWPAGA